MRSSILIAILIIIGSVKAFSQTEQEILPAERKQLTIVSEPFTLYKGFFRVGVTFQYSALYKTFDADGKRVPISNASGTSWASQLLLQYGITDRFMVTAALPYRNQNLALSYRAEAPGFNFFGQQKLEGEGSGLSDVWIGLDYQLLTETLSRPSLKVALTGTIPTGEANPVDTSNDELFDMPVGDGYYSIDVALSVRKVSYPFSYSGYVSYKYNLEASKQFDLGQPEQNFKDGAMVTASGAFSFNMNEWLALTNDVYYFYFATDQVEGQDVEDSQSWTVQYVPRLSFQIKRLRVNQAITIPILGKLAGADPGFILVIQYVF